MGAAQEQINLKCSNAVTNSVTAFPQIPHGSTALRHDATDTEQDITSSQGRAATAPLSAEQAPPYEDTSPSATRPIGEERARHSHTPHRTPLIAPFLLIVLGVLFLLNNFGMLDRSVWSQLWRLWPLIPIAIGAEMLLARRNRMLSPLIMLGVLAAGVVFVLASGGFQGHRMSMSKTIMVPSKGANSAHLNVQFTAGRLNISSMDQDGPDLVRGTLEYTEKQREPLLNIKREDNAASIFINENNPPTYKGDSRLDWTLLLGRQTPFSLSLVADGVKANLNLSDLNISSLDLTLKANDTTIQFPSTPQSTKAIITVEAADLDLIIPSEVEARIEIASSEAADIDVDEDRFATHGQAYQTKGYNQADNKVTIVLRVRASHVDIKSR